MALITLTDRISVSVRAKNDSQASSQKRDTGKNIAKALGNENISDALADEIGATSKPTIADEQGREWVAMSDIIAAGKKMQQEGVFEEKTSYRYGNVACIRIADLPSFLYKGNKENPAYWHTWYGPFYKSIGKISGVDEYWYIRPTNENSNDIYTKYMGATRNINTGTIRVLKTSGGSFYVNSFDTAPMTDNSHGISSSSGSNSYVMRDGYQFLNLPITDVGTDVGLEQYGDFHEETSGGSLIDWTKPDDEIEEDIRKLHETWDVTEHAGSTTANGTYVLAGPIEFNPGD